MQPIVINRRVARIFGVYTSNHGLYDKGCDRERAEQVLSSAVQTKLANTESEIEEREGIGKLRRRRLKEMGGEVQREHEVCLANILELQWHVSFTERKLGSAER